MKRSERTTAKKLTQKQEGFCQDYILTGNASEAYRRNYNASNCSDTTINRKAKELIDNGKIAARIEELHREMKKEFDVSVSQKKRWLVQVIKAGMESLDNGKPKGLSATVSAISELNRMDGDHAPAKHKVGTDDELSSLLKLIPPSLGPPCERPDFRRHKAIEAK